VHYRCDGRATVPQAPKDEQKSFSSCPSNAASTLGDKDTEVSPVTGVTGLAAVAACGCSGAAPAALDGVGITEAAPLNPDMPPIDICFSLS
jgi:hypothetical protein